MPKEAAIKHRIAQLWREGRTGHLPLETVQRALDYVFGPGKFKAVDEAA